MNNISLTRILLYYQTILARMNRPWLKVFLFVSLLCWSQFSVAQSKDTLYFYNHTKIVGKLLSVHLGRFEFDADGVGIINVKNSKIESIHATYRSFRIETIEGEELQGYLMRSEKSGMVLIHAIVESKEIAVDDIVNLVYYGKTVKSRMAGNISSGYTYTKSSEIGRLNLDGMIKYNTARTQTKLKGDMIFTSDSVKAYTERANMTLSHEHTFAPLWGVIGLLKYQRNLELGLERRWQQALGVGREFLINKQQQAGALAGLAVNQERNEEGAEANTTEAMFQVNYNLFSFVKPNITLSFVESGFVSLTDKNRIRLDGDINLDYEIIADFYVSLQFYHNYDSRSPATDAPNVDYGFVAGLRYKF